MKATITIKDTNKGTGVSCTIDFDPPIQAEGPETPASALATAMLEAGMKWLREHRTPNSKPKAMVIHQ